MEGAALGSYEIQINPGLINQPINIIRFFKVDGQLDWKPTITRAFINIYFHFQKLNKDIFGLVEDSVMDGSPPFFSKFIDYEGFCFLKLNQLMLFDILRIILKNIQKPINIFGLDASQHFFALRV